MLTALFPLSFYSAIGKSPVKVIKNVSEYFGSNPVERSFRKTHSVKRKEVIKLMQLILFLEQYLILRDISYFQLRLFTPKLILFENILEVMKDDV